MVRKLKASLESTAGDAAMQELVVLLFTVALADDHKLSIADFNV